MSDKTLTGSVDRPLRGIVLMLIAFLVFSFIDASAKWLVLAGLSALQVGFMRYAGAMVISLFFVVRSHKGLGAFRTDHLGLVLLRSLALMGATVFNFIALQYLPLTLTATIMFASPIIVCALSGPFLGERVGVWRWTAICFGFVGVLVAIRPFDAEFNWAIVYSLIMTFCFAAFSLLTRKLAGKVDVDTLQLYAAAVGSLALAPFALTLWQHPANALDWWVMLLIGVFAWVGHEILIRAHHHAPASTLSPFVYTMLIYLTVWSMLLFDQPPDRWTLFGAAIIVLSGLVIWYREREKAKLIVDQPDPV